MTARNELIVKKKRKKKVDLSFTVIKNTLQIFQRKCVHTYAHTTIMYVFEQRILKNNSGVDFRQIKLIVDY